MPKKLTLNEFVEKSRKIHGDKYDYSKVEYINSQTKICIICPIHGEFWQTPNQHLSGHNCPKCSHKSYAYTTEEFLCNAKQVHGDKYDYSKVKYINNKTKVCIVCPTHGEFWQTPDKHLNRKQGCPKCKKNYKITLDDFVKRAKQIHGDKYDYSKVEYVNCDTKVCIICPTHGEFWQAPHHHLNGVGCKYCANDTNISENKIFNLLKKNFDFEIIQQYKPKWLNGKRIDIFIPSLNIGVEYQGIQHFQPINFFGGIEKFYDNVKRDKIKYEECKLNNIKLLYFSYEKKLPKNYIDFIFNNENEFINYIKNYDYNRRDKTLV